MSSKGIIAESNGNDRIVVFYNPSFAKRNERYPSDVEEFIHAIEGYQGEATILGDSEYHKHDSKCIAIKVSTLNTYGHLDHYLESTCIPTSEIEKAGEKPTVQEICKAAYESYLKSIQLG